MPDSGWLHPIVVHFVVALGLVGVAFRWVAWIDRVPFAGPAAAALLVLAAVAAVVAARSGEDASVLVEPVPGRMAPVDAHRLWGRRARTALVVTAALETAALVRPRTRVAPTLAGLAAAACVLQAGRRGGDLVYGWAAGVGVRSGEPADVGRLLVAALVQQANADDRAGRPADAAALVDLAARRFPSDAGVRLLEAQSLLRRHDPAAALAVLDGLAPGDDPRLRFRRGWLTADALEAVGRPDDAATTLQRLRRDFPEDARLTRRLAHGAGPDW